MREDSRHALVLELSPAQRDRIDRVAKLLHTSAGDFVRLMVFSGLDSETNWSEFSRFAQSYIETRPLDHASDAPVGCRIEDQAASAPLLIVEE